MKLFSLFAIILFCKISLFAQLIPELKNLEGAWYRSGRAAVCYSVWAVADENTLENQTFSIICGDTVALSRATIAGSQGIFRMSLQADSTGNGLTQIFRLVRFSDDELVWENENPAGTPREISWLFFGNNYASFLADSVDTGYRRKRAPMKVDFRVSAGFNLSTFSDQRSPHGFLALQNVYFNEVSYQRLPGQELAISAGLLFPETRLRLNFELGVARRQVGVNAHFFSAEASYSRDGVYDYFNTYFALVPEVFVGKKRDFSFSAGFYADLAQQRSFRGDGTSTAPNATHADPRQDIDRERGLLAGVAYCLPFWKKWQPAMYVRNMFGLNNTRVRAISLGVSFQIGKK